MAHLNRRRYLGIAIQSAFVRLVLNACWVFLFSFLMYGCARHEAPTATAPQATPTDKGASTTASSLSPTLTEVNAAVTRVFKNAATIDSKRNPSFIAGDFNGDSSPDLAVILLPASGKLAEMNQEFPPWILKDLLVAANRNAPPARVATGEALLAIIHGYGPGGWRDAQATQTYLLKHAVGLEVRARPKSDLPSAGQGKTLPRLVGDLIGENLRGKPGYLYFNGAQYVWYDPTTFKGEPETRLTHPGMNARKKIDLLHPNLVAAEK